MPLPSDRRTRILVVLLALCAEAALLGREHLAGGVQSHHLLADRSLPAVSNWWGLLLMPLLAWLSAASAQRRAARRGALARPGMPPGTGFLIALAYGILVAALFVGGSTLVGLFFFGVLVLAPVVRLWHPEYLLGLVFGMCWAVGPVLPAMFGAVIALAAWLLHLAAQAFWRRLRPRREPA